MEELDLCHVVYYFLLLLYEWRTRKKSFIVEELGKGAFSPMLFSPEYGASSQII
jgi:hypothetical protein